MYASNDNLNENFTPTEASMLSEHLSIDKINTDAELVDWLKTSRTIIGGKIGYSLASKLSHLKAEIVSDLKLRLDITAAQEQQINSKIDKINEFLTQKWSGALKFKLSTIKSLHPFFQCSDSALHLKVYDQYPHEVFSPDALSSYYAARKRAYLACGISIERSKPENFYSSQVVFYESPDTGLLGYYAPSRMPGYNEPLLIIDGKLVDESCIYKKRKYLSEIYEKADLVVTVCRHIMERSLTLSATKDLDHCKAVIYAAKLIREKSIQLGQPPELIRLDRSELMQMCETTAENGYFAHKGNFSSAFKPTMKPILANEIDKLEAELKQKVHLQYVRRDVTLPTVPMDHSNPLCALSVFEDNFYIRKNLVPAEDESRVLRHLMFKQMPIILTTQQACEVFGHYKTYEDHKVQTLNRIINNTDAANLFFDFIINMASVKSMMYMPRFNITIPMYDVAPNFMNFSVFYNEVISTSDRGAYLNLLSNGSISFNPHDLHVSMNDIYRRLSLGEVSASARHTPTVKRLFYTTLEDVPGFSGFKKPKVHTAQNKSKKWTK